jgi:hypothetical protein
MIYKREETEKKSDGTEYKQKAKGLARNEDAVAPALKPNLTETHTQRY